MAVHHDLSGYENEQPSRGSSGFHSIGTCDPHIDGAFRGTLAELRCDSAREDNESTRPAD